MKIAIVGAGVLGSIFGSLFSEKGFDVTLIEMLEERVRLIDKEGLWLEWPDGRRTHSRVSIAANAAEVGAKDVVMVAVKGYHTRSAIESARPMIGEKTLVLSVQNGLGNLETLSEVVGPERVIGGFTAHSGMPVSMNEVRYVGGLGPLLVIGPFDGVMRPGFEAMVKAFQAAGLDVHTAPDINAVIWKKLIANVSTNVVAALTGLTGGTAVGHGPTVKIIEHLSRELAKVARARGIDIPELEDPLDFSLKAFASTKDNRVSMLQDVEAGRPTEIGNLNEVIVSEGRRLNIPTPYNEAVSLLVRGGQFPRVRGPSPQLRHRVHAGRGPGKRGDGHRPRDRHPGPHRPGPGGAHPGGTDRGQGVRDGVFTPQGKRPIMPRPVPFSPMGIGATGLRLTF